MSITNNDVCDLVSTVLPDLYYVKINHKTKIINIYFGFFEKEIIVELSIDRIINSKHSAKDFFDYLKKEITKQVKEKINE